MTQNQAGMGWYGTGNFPDGVFQWGYGGAELPPVWVHGVA